METQEENNALPIGSMLREYKILSVLGQGGFGITYKVHDTNLDATMVIKEYMPNQFASRSNNSTVTCISYHKDTFEWGKQRFLEEARVVKKFDHISIVKVLNLFEMNGTAYFVMDFYDGETLEDYLIHHKNHKFTQDEILSVMMPILEGLKVVHNAGFLHRDIAPDNIFLRIDKSPILIDFGASRNALGVKSQTISSIVKNGYSPPEQYTSNSKQDASTDLYAISAVIYEMITDKKPPESTYRQIEDHNGSQDPLEDIVNKYQDRFEESFLQTVVKGLSLKQKDRVQSIREFQEGLVGEIKKPTLTPLPTPPPTPNNRGIIIAILVSAIAIIGAIFLKDFIKEDDNTLVKPIELTKEQQLQKSCEIGNLKDCNTLGIMYIKGDGVKKDPTKALELFKKSCDGSYALGCGNLGVIYDDGHGVNKDKSKAIEIFKKACDGGDIDRCGSLGVMYEKGDVVTQDKTKALEFFIKACNGGNVDLCVALGLRYLKGYKVKKDPTKALELLTKACDGGNVDGCRLIGVMYDNGDGVKQDKTKAIELYTKVCDAGDVDVCNNLGLMYAKGDGVEKDFLKALKPFSKACDGGNAFGCRFLGVMYADGDVVNQDKTKAIEFFIKACDGNDTFSCKNLGLMYDTGDGVNKDKTKAIELYTKACDGGNAFSCKNLGLMYILGDGVEKNMNKAMNPFKKACDGGNVMGCRILGVMYADGNGVNQDKTKAIELYKKGCDGNDTLSCKNLGFMYAKGIGIEKDNIKALYFFQKACKYGNTESCSNAQIVQKKINDEKSVKPIATLTEEEKQERKCDNGDTESCSNVKRMTAMMIDLKNITKIDNLMWQDEPYTKKEKKYLTDNKNYNKVLNWKLAKNYCKNLTLGGFDDWYLPSKEELKNLYKNKDKLKNIISKGYWSSTANTKDTIFASVIDFNDGYPLGYPKYNAQYVRCVRVGQ